MELCNVYVMAAILTAWLIATPQISCSGLWFFKGNGDEMIFLTPEFISEACRDEAYTHQSTTVKILDRTVEQWHKNAYIICCTALLSKPKFSWTFANTYQSLTSQPSVMHEADNCEKKVGAYQLKDIPNVAIVCAMNFTLHRGEYTCTVKNDEMKIHASKSMVLDIHVQPTFRIIPSVRQILIPYKESRELECIATANPPVEPKWYKHVQPDQSHEMRPGDHFVSIKKVNVAWSPEAEGFYFCMAEQKGRISRSKEVNVTVESAPPSVTKSTLSKLFLQILYSLAPFLLVSLLLLLWNRVQWIRLKFPPELTPNEGFQLDPARSVQEQAAELPYNIHLFDKALSNMKIYSAEPTNIQRGR